VRYRTDIAAVLIVAFLELAARPAAAQTVIPAGRSPGYKVTVLSWLEGHWTGVVNGGALSADLIMSAPGEGGMFGVARISQGTQLAVVELLSLIDGPSGPELRFRHFSGELKLYEPDFQQDMLLTAVSDTDFTFTNQVPYSADKMSTQPRVTRFIRRGADVMVGRSDIIGDDGNPATVESVYHRLK
jgi:hypothetical protein